MNDVKCPYCGEEVYINHDDGYGYDEDVLHKQECSNCGKAFVFTTSIVFYYEAYKADCLNGGEHEWRQTRGAPEAFFVGKYECKTCGEVKILDEEASRKAIAEYIQK